MLSLEYDVKLPGEKEDRLKEEPHLSLVVAGDVKNGVCGVMLPSRSVKSELAGEGGKKRKGGARDGNTAASTSSSKFVGKKWLAKFFS